MRTTILCIKLLMIVYLCLAEEETYPATWDGVNLDEILTNERLLNKYGSCLKNEGRCSSDGSALKRFLPDALITKCKKCTEKQKEGAEKVILHLSTKEPQLWKDMSAIYDPDGRYYKEFLAYIEEKKSKST